MKNIGSILVVIAAFFLASAHAAEFSVENVSNSIIACSTDNNEGSLLAAFAEYSGGPACISYPPSALLLTITTAPDEYPLGCSGRYCAPAYDTYIVAFHAGRPFIFAPYLVGEGTGMRPRQLLWQPLPEDIASVEPSRPWRLPFSALDGQIKYGQVTGLYLDDTERGLYPPVKPMSELEIYVAITPVGQKLFTPASVRKIWPLAEPAP